MRLLGNEIYILSAPLFVLSIIEVFNLDFSVLTVILMTENYCLTLLIFLRINILQVAYCNNDN